ncbi:Nicotinamide/nicotinic acid mononucleotide adenylyltransferase 1 [Candida viswanathii]|jgi:nicotinamide mononucleotide adenylyltransferase|uniref:Nicotinamide-nucleotide adenylyltransferase n=1 Tax=Candida viswanathii TaxID=5486 RepID=A0A367YAN2_9ASCO|nr:Nicotinamide/nicotinic acid mononucleotide adenylyltransferase 1 [Candida viswanathii]
MDPTNDPNFTPPSLNKNIEPTAPSHKIPHNIPIEPFVLEDLGQGVDTPAPHPAKSTRPTVNSSKSYDSNQVQSDSEGKYHSKIPRKHTELISSLSSDEENDTKEEFLVVEENENSHKVEILPPSIKVRSSQIADLEEVPHGVQRQASKLGDYKFPTHRLATTLTDDSKHPLVIVACGSFSPITYLHLRMFEMALDAVMEQTRFEVIGGYYSPVSSNYKKQGLAPAHHRVRMCELACERTSSWLMVDAWESLQPKYTRTALVLDHFNEEINIKRGGIMTRLGEKRGVKIMLLAGGDLIESMGEPDVWADQDLHHILGKYGCLIVERTGSDVRSFLLSHDILYEHRKNIMVIKQLIYNDISSTKIRLFIRRGMSVQYLLPNSVIRYIQQHKLYCDSEPVKQVMSERAD